MRPWCAAAAVSLALASPAGAESNGVPLIDGTWEGTLRAVTFDQTLAGSTDPKRKFRGSVSVTIEQNAGAFDGAFSFSPAFGGFAAVNLEGNVGNHHLSIGFGADDPPLVGSGKISRDGNKITIRGVNASVDETAEFVMKLKRMD